MIVTMFDNARKNVAEGVVSAVGVGEWLEGDRLQPTNIAILITNVFKPATVIQKILKDIMGKCLHNTIRWLRRHVRGTRRVAIENVEEAMRVFDYSEDPPGLQHQTPSSIGPDRSEMDSNEFPIPGFECPTTDGLLAGGTSMFLSNVATCGDKVTWESFDGGTSN